MSWLEITAQESENSPSMFSAIFQFFAAILLHVQINTVIFSHSQDFLHSKGQQNMAPHHYI